MIDYPNNIPVKSGDVLTLNYYVGGSPVAYGNYDFIFSMTTAKLVCPSCASGVCAASGANGSAPGSNGTNDSVNYSMTLGGNSPSNIGGSLTLYTRTLLGNLTGNVNQIYTSKALNLVLPADAITIAGSDPHQSFRQIRTSQGLVDLLTSVNSTTYELDFYRLSQVANTTTNGTYAILSSPAYMKCTFEDPGLSGNAGENLRVTRNMTDTGTVTQFLYQWNGNYTYGNLTLQGWKLTTSEGNATLRTEGVYRSTSGNGTELRIITDGGNTVAQTLRTYDGNFTRILTEQLGSLSPNRTTTYTYYPYNATAVNDRNNMESTTEWTGQWTLYGNYDSYARETIRVEQIGNNPFSNSTTNTSDHVFATDYTGDNGTLQADTETYANVTVGRHWQKLATYGNLSDGKSDLRKIIDATATDPASTTYSNTTNLITTTYLYDITNNSTGAKENAPFLVVNPDGTATKYLYYSNTTTGCITTVTLTGNLASGPSGYSASIDHGTVTTTITDQYGSLVNSTTVDIASNITFVSKNVTSADAFGRPLTITYLGGLAENYTYDCCADLEMTDRYGVVTKSTYDGLHRLTLQQQYAEATSGAPPELDTTYTYDAAGRQTAVGVGPSGNVSLQHVTHNTYNDAGELISSTDAAGRTTTYATAMSGNFVEKTTTYPDHSTRVEDYYQDGTLYKVTGTAVHAVQYTYGVDAGTHARYTITTPLMANGTAVTDANVTEYTDFAGRPWKTVAPSPTGSGTVTTENHYNSKGQLDKVSKTDQPDELYTYDELGHQHLVGQDIDHGGLSLGGTDRVTETTTSYTTAHSKDVQEVTTTQWLSGGNITTTTDTAIDGNGTWVTQDGLETDTILSYDRTNATITQTVVHPDTTQTVTVTRNGRTLSVTQYSSGNVQLAQTTYSYDDYNQVTTQTDAHAGNTTFTYDELGRVLATTLPAVGGVSQVVANAYVDGNVTTDGYSLTTTTTRSASGTDVETSVVQTLPTGETLLAYGASGPAAQYTYDYAGRPVTLTTWQGFTGNTGNSTGAANTTWTYGNTGLVMSKTYNDASNITYTYATTGQLLTRQWARAFTSGGNTSPLECDYAYDNATRDLTGISYTDGNLTHAVSYGNYDQLGRPTVIADGSGSRTLTYTHGVVTTENYTAGVLGNFTLTRGLDGNYRVNEVKLQQGNSTISDVLYAWNSTTGRLGNVTWGNETATYDYVANSSLVANTTFAHSATTKLTTARDYDNLNRLTNITNVPTGSGGNANYTYAYNNRNQRMSATRADGTYWSYGYDSDGNSTALGQVTSANVALANGTVLPGLDAAYTYDTLGNRQTFTRNPGNGTLTTSGNYYANATGNGTVGANLLNQYTGQEVPRQLEVLGVVAANATVAVNGASAILTGNTHWYKQLTVSGNDAAWSAVNITAALAGNTSVETGRLFLAANPEPYKYDADGNLLSDGRWSYVWDAENRLAALVTSPAAVAAGVARQTIVYGYDSQNRRIGKAVYDYNPAGDATWQLTQSVKYLYDGYNLLAEMDAMPSTPALVRAYAWGLDLSGTMQGAGGVGGLLMASLNDGSNPTQTVYYGYDGNGNVIALVDTSGNVVANYDYDAFGNGVQTTGYWARFNPVRFSTKYNETNATYAGREVGLYLYPSRPYSPGLGRWLTRDPSNESGGINLYGNRNDLISRIDPTGLRVINLEFNAFIPPISRVGASDPNWFPEPFAFSKYEFKGDARGFGGGTSRVKATASLLSEKIGKIMKLGYTMSSSGSIRRRIGATQEEWRGATVYGDITFSNPTPCSTVIKFDDIRGAYAFDPALSPKIDFTVTWTLTIVGKKMIDVKVSGEHNLFPNYEALVNHQTIYPFITMDKGPSLSNLNSSMPFGPAGVTLINIETP